MSYDAELFTSEQAERMALPVFYATVHRPGWLWDGRVDFPLMLSFRTLRTVKRPKPAAVRWCLDSGGFTELSMHGRWTFSVREYVEAVARLDQAVGGLDWAASMDMMCEPDVIHGGRAGMVTFAGTGLTVAAHQQITVANFLEATRWWPQYSDQECPFMPTLQGYLPAEYEVCHDLYEKNGVRLADYPLVPVGSVCRRSSTRAILDVVTTVNQMDLSTHWFGVKLAGVKLAALAQGTIQRGGDLYPHGPASLDSAAWSFAARYGEPLGDGLCSHRGKCNNCHRYAAAYRERVLAVLRAAYRQRLEARAQEGLNLAA